MAAATSHRDTPGPKLPQWIHDRLPPNLADALGIFVAAAFSLGVSGAAAYLLKQPLLFPSLGPTVYLMHDTPTAPSASPRNTLIGHFVAILAGASMLYLFGLQDAPPATMTGVNPARIAAAALSVALTGAGLHLSKARHPPAGATTLIVSLGLLKTPHELLMIAVGVVLLTVVCWGVNQLSGVPVPVWGAPPAPPSPEPPAAP